MPKNEERPQQDKLQDTLIEQYRAIGPAMLVAALMSKKNHVAQARNDNTNRSILAVKKSG